MKKFNFRLLTALAVSLLVGLLACYYRPTLKGFSLPILFVAFTVAFFVSIFLFPNASFKKRLFTVLLCFDFSAVGYFRLSYKISVYEGETAKVGNVTVSGTVEETFSSGDGSVVLKDCVYGGERGWNIILSGINGVGVGDKITATCKAYKAPTVVSGKYSFYALNNARSIGGDVSLVSVDGAEGGIFYSAREKIKSVVFSVGDGTAERIAYALLVGDSSLLKEEEKSSFRLGGIAHIFAVSGMHLGLFFLLLRLILRPVGINFRLKNLVIFLALLFYSGVCGFSPSSLRATIMLGVFLSANSFGEKPDRLNALAVASLIVSLLSPSDVVGVGFILSFSISLSIIILAPPVREKLRFLGEKFSLALSVLISAELTALPICAVNFGSFPLVAFLSNMLILPAVTVAFYLLWAGVILAGAFRALSFVLSTALLMIDGLYGFAKFFAGGLAITEFPKPFLAVYYPLLFLCGDEANIIKRRKLAYFLCAMGILTVSFVLSCL